MRYFLPNPMDVLCSIRLERTNPAGTTSSARFSNPDPSMLHERLLLFARTIKATAVYRQQVSVLPSPGHAPMIKIDEIPPPLRNTAFVSFPCLSHHAVNKTRTNAIFPLTQWERPEKKSPAAGGAVPPSYLPYRDKLAREVTHYLPVALWFGYLQFYGHLQTFSHR